MDETDVVHGIEFLGKIVSTTVDNFEHLKQVGLVTLDVLLENDSPLSHHLKKCEIEIKPNTHELFYKGERFYIPSYGKDCEWCVYGDEQCRYSDQRYKNMYCPYRKAILSLSTKLYCDNAEIEMFLAASKSEMLEYSTVKNYPEIFVTIEKFISEWFNSTLKIGAEWAKIKQYSYIITVPVKYNNISYRKNYISSNDGADANDVLWRYQKFCNEVYAYAEQVPTCFWDNVWLISICLDLICSPGEISNFIYAGIKHDVVIPYDRLTIDLI